MTQLDGWLKVRGLDCPTEEARIRHALEDWPGLLNLQFDLSGGRVRVTYDSATTNLQAIRSVIENDCGYGCQIASFSDSQPGSQHSANHAHDHDHSHKHDHDHDHNHETASFWLGSRTLVILTAGLAEFAGLGLWYLGYQTSADIFFGISIFCSALWIAPRVWDGLRRRRLDIFVLVGLAMVGATFLGQWDEAATVGFLFGISEILESFAARRAKHSIQALVELQPDRAEKVLPDGSINSVDPASVQIGEIVRVRPGQKIPVDGRVREGVSQADQKVITGESVPVEIGPQSEVFAGTINGDGVIFVESLRHWNDSVLNRIAKRVEEARFKRSPIERLVDQFARRYTPAVVIIACLVATLPPLFQIIMHEPVEWRNWLMRGLVLLVIACPCALVISTPVAVVSALANAARNGILIRDGRVIEQFGHLFMLAFDKTGTLTVGAPDVVDYHVNGPDQQDQSLLVKAAAIGRDGSHVVSRAIVRHVNELDLQVPQAVEVKEVPGLGTTGLVANERIHVGSHRYLDQIGLCQPNFHDQLTQRETEVGISVAVANADGPLGWIRLADKPRPEAADVVKKLKNLGVRTLMLTGDNPATAQAITSQLGIDEVKSRLMPDEKATIIADLMRQHGLVGMVGDGVNDAPALAVASVGVSMGSIASAVTHQAADVVLINNNLNSLPRLIMLSRKTLAVIKANVFLAIGAKLAVICLAIFGIAHFWLAMMADVGVSLLVVANALRMLRYEPKSDLSSL